MSTLNDVYINNTIKKTNYLFLDISYKVAIFFYMRHQRTDHNTFKL